MVQGKARLIRPCYVASLTCFWSLPLPLVPSALADKPFFLIPEGPSEELHRICVRICLCKYLVPCIATSQKKRGTFGLAQGEALRQQTERLSKRLQRLEELGGASPSRGCSNIQQGYWCLIWGYNSFQPGRKGGFWACKLQRHQSDVN